MGNPWEGEVAIRFGGARHVMKLTLGALAELEASMAADSLVALVERFETGAFSTRDVLALIVAGLRGGGWRGDASDLLTVEIEGGAPEAARLAGQLLVRAFAYPDA
jgi:hypothetical protein